MTHSELTANMPNARVLWHNKPCVVLTLGSNRLTANNPRSKDKAPQRAMVRFEDGEMDWVELEDLKPGRN